MIFTKRIAQLLHMAFASTLCIVNGCGPADGESFDLVETQKEIRNGTITNKRGVIEIYTEDSGCTGALIGPSHAITAGHCVFDALDGEHEGWIEASFYYFDPDTGKRFLTSGWLYAYVKENYTGADGDTHGDLALLSRWGKWESTDTSDYLRLSRGNCHQVDKNTFYGRGYSGFNGLGSGTLRTMGWDNKWCGHHHFFGLEGHAALCKGDSGGPHIVNESGWELIAGLHSNHEIAFTGSKRCAKENGKMRAVRINENNVNWIESKLGFSCNRYSANGHPYSRCW